MIQEEIPIYEQASSNNNAKFQLEAVQWKDVQSNKGEKLAVGERSMIY